MNLSDMFEMSRQMHPDAGVTLSPAACGFIRPTIEAAIEKTEGYLKSLPTDDTIGRPMTERHLEGLQAILALIEQGEKK